MPLTDYYVTVKTVPALKESRPREDQEMGNHMFCAKYQGSTQLGHLTGLGEVREGFPEKVASKQRAEVSQVKGGKESPMQTEQLVERLRVGEKSAHLRTASLGETEVLGWQISNCSQDFFKLLKVIEDTKYQYLMRN